MGNIRNSLPELFRVFSNRLLFNRRIKEMPELWSRYEEGGRIMTNYFDDRGNYINCENLSLRKIYERAFDEGYKKGYIDGALHPTGNPAEIFGGNPSRG